MRDHVLSLIERYIGGEMRFSGGSNVALRCPFHKGGQERSPSFSVNVDLGLFFCFTCHLAGPITKLLQLLGLPPSLVEEETKDIKHLLEDNKAALAFQRRAQWVFEDPFAAKPVLSDSVIQAYTDWRKQYSQDPTGLTQLGFSPALLDHMNIGFDASQARVIYPVRDIYGQLAGVVGGATQRGVDPKYKVYQGRRKVQYGTRRSDFFWSGFDETYPNYAFENRNYLWNYERVYPHLFFGKEEEQTLIVVEGFKACLWLLQCGFRNTVALMGSSMTDMQRNLLLRLQARLFIFLDNNEAGRYGAEKIGRDLFRSNTGVFFVPYPAAAHDGYQPDWLRPDELTAALAGAVWYPQRRKRDNS